MYAQSVERGMERAYLKWVCFILTQLGFWLQTVLVKVWWMERTAGKLERRVWGLHVAMGEVGLGWCRRSQTEKKKREREKRRPKLGETGRRDSGHARIDEATSGAVYSFSDCNNFQWQEGKIGASITITNQ
jgi:hypothetical protein